MVWLCRKERQRKLCKNWQFQDASKYVSIHQRGRRMQVWRKDAANLSAWTRWRKGVDIHPFDGRYAHGWHVIMMIRYLWTSWLSDTMLPQAVDNFRRYVLLPKELRLSFPLSLTLSVSQPVCASASIPNHLYISEDMPRCMCSWGTPIYNDIWWLHLTKLLSEAFSTKALLT